MEAIRIDVHAYTASFRVPGMMGYQVTSPVPPPSTVYGLIAAAAGRPVSLDETWIAYRFHYDCLARDLEKVIIYGKAGPVWDIKQNLPKTNVLTREFLFGAELTLYLAPGAAADAFLRPRYPLLLGRSQDVAYVATWTKVSLNPIESAELSGVILPFPVRDRRLSSRIMSFPTYFGVEPRRTPRAVMPFHVLDVASGSQLVTVPGLLYQEPRGAPAVPLLTKEHLAHTST